ncbi:MAG TPA: type VI secretion system baseplate subunit TssK [Planctomycetaceae bacterium]|nr:type VI secretion system baseplate subunit TssK [Planctomycetaceae bacterium]
MVMQHLPVHWHEGLFLRAHHFQAADRAAFELRNTSERWDHPYRHGLYALEYSSEALANGFFEIQRISARLPDGTIIDLGHDATPDRRSVSAENPSVSATNLQDAFDQTAVVRVYIGVPRRLSVGPNVDVRNGHPVTTRFIRRDLVLTDDSEGGNEQEVSLRELNVQVLLSTDDLSGYDVLPIAQVRRSSAEGAVPEIDLDYIPPLITLEAWQSLGRGTVRAIYDTIGRKAEVLSRELSSRGTDLDGQTPGDLERILLLGCLNEAQAVLGALTFSRGLHPFTVFVELCRVAGRLGLLTPTRRTGDLPQYNHDDLATVFRQLQRQIELSLTAVRDYEHRRHEFVGAGLGMQLTFDASLRQSNWQWFVGVYNTELSANELQELLSPGHLDWKLGSARQVNELFAHRAAGLEMVPLNRTVRALPPRAGWSYYEIPRGDSPAWLDVLETETVAIRFKDSLIVNRTDLEGSREITVRYRGRPVTLRFALFAVDRP